MSGFLPVSSHKCLHVLATEMYSYKQLDTSTKISMLLPAERKYF